MQNRVAVLKLAILRVSGVPDATAAGWRLLSLLAPQPLTSGDQHQESSAPNRTHLRHRGNIHIVRIVLKHLRSSREESRAIGIREDDARDVTRVPGIGRKEKLTTSH